MADRPPEFWESLAERRIREAAERGEFDDLPGSGEPLPGLDGTYDPAWWVKAWLARTTLDETAAELRRSIHRELPLLRATAETKKAADRIAELNRAVEELNRKLPPGDRLDPIEG